MVDLDACRLSLCHRYLMVELPMLALSSGIIPLWYKLLCWGFFLLLSMEWSRSRRLEEESRRVREELRKLREEK